MKHNRYPIAFLACVAFYLVSVPWVGDYSLAKALVPAFSGDTEAMQEFLRFEEADTAVELGSPADEMAQVATHCRSRHLREKVPWQQMAVVVRSASDLAGVRLELGQTSRPADDGAAARLRRIVREHGPAVRMGQQVAAAKRCRQPRGRVGQGARAIDTASLR